VYAGAPLLLLPMQAVKQKIGADTGSFVSSISGLQANTTYYVRAYASNSDAISYAMN